MIAYPWQPRIHVGEIGHSEAEILADIHGEAFARMWSAEDFASLLAERTVFALGLWRVSIFTGRRLAGFVLVRFAADEAEILTIAVRSGDRGRGYGRMLMEEALRRLYRERVAACFLEVDRGNVAAIALYASLGFAVAGERKNYYRDLQAGDRSALVMRVQVR